MKNKKDEKMINKRILVLLGIIFLILLIPSVVSTWKDDGILNGYFNSSTANWTCTGFFSSGGGCAWNSGRMEIYSDGSGFGWSRQLFTPVGNSINITVISAPAYARCALYSEAYPYNYLDEVLNCNGGTYTMNTASYIGTPIWIYLESYYGTMVVDNVTNLANPPPTSITDETKIRMSQISNLESTLNSYQSKKYDNVASWDSSSTKTNIGTSMVDIYTGTNSNGKGMLIDTSNYTLGRVLIQWNKIGTGTQYLRIIDNSSNVLFTTTVISGANDYSFSIPSNQQNITKWFKIQANSTTSGDDPVFESLSLLMK